MVTLSQTHTRPKVLREDDEIVYISKPAGVLVHPVKGTPNSGPGAVTVSDAAMRCYGERGISTVGEYPGIVHRLDRCVEAQDVTLEHGGTTYD